MYIISIPLLNDLIVATSTSAKMVTYSKWNILGLPSHSGVLDHSQTIKRHTYTTKSKLDAQEIIWGISKRGIAE